jgi:glycerol-3-phosphate acyltransferase PlsY
LIPQFNLAVTATAGAAETQMLACGFAAIIGHCYPLWHGFRGGKGAATAVGALLVIQPLALVPMIITWLLVLTVTGWVGLATMLAAFCLIPAFYGLGASFAQMVFAVMLAAFIVFMHRSNISNMRNGTEYHFEKARIKNWFG